MACTEPRGVDEARAIAALEQMDDESLAAMAVMMEEVAKKHPRAQRTKLSIVPVPPEK